MNLLYIAFSSLCALVGFRQLAQRPKFYKPKRCDSSEVSTVTESKPPRFVTQSWFEQAWPLTQITLHIECNSEQLKTTVLSRLGHASNDIREHANHRFITHDIKGDFSCQFICRQTTDGASFFFEAYGSKTSPGVYSREFGGLHFGDDREHIAILVQGIRTTERDTLADWLLKIAIMIAKGEREGTMHDDDAGWSFRVRSAMQLPEDECVNSFSVSR